MGSTTGPSKETCFFCQMLIVGRMKGPNLEGNSEKQRRPEEITLEFRILCADCIYVHLSEIGNLKSSQCWIK